MVLFVVYHIEHLSDRCLVNHFEYSASPQYDVGKVINLLCVRALAV